MILYHVTFVDSLAAIMAEGLRPATKKKERVWRNRWGAALGQAAIYAFTDRDDAVLWASKQGFDFNRLTAVIVFESGPRGTAGPEAVWTEEESIVHDWRGGSLYLPAPGTVPAEAITEVFVPVLAVVRATVERRRATFKEE